MSEELYYKEDNIKLQKTIKIVDFETKLYSKEFNFKLRELNILLSRNIEDIQVNKTTIL